AGLRDECGSFFTDRKPRLQLGQMTGRSTGRSHRLRALPPAAVAMTSVMVGMEAMVVMEVMMVVIEAMVVMEVMAMAVVVNHRTRIVRGSGFADWRHRNG